MPDDQRNWRLRAISATRGNQTMFGAVVIAILNQQSRNPPRLWRGGAVIDTDGNITSVLQTRDGKWHNNTPIGHVQDFTNELNQLADVCKMDDAERLQLFEEAQKWITRDHRAKSGLQ